LAALTALLEAIASGDQAAMHDLLVPDGGATHSRDGRVFHMRLGDEPARWVRGTEHKEERIYDPLVRVEADIAMVWAAYDFLLDSVVHHSGTNIVSFLKEDGRWRVCAIVDSGRTGSRPAGELQPHNPASHSLQSRRRQQPTVPSSGVDLSLNRR
jgi:hypothetical protein